MAAAAGNLSMFSRQRKFGDVMIKVKFIPAPGVMTFAALLTEVTLVRVLITMTIEAAGRCFREFLV